MNPFANAKFPGESILRQRYLVEKMTTYQVADSCGVSRSLICQWLKFFRIETRDAGNTTRNRGIVVPTKEELTELVHVQHRTYLQIAKSFRVDATTVMNWMIAHQIPRPTVSQTRQGKNGVVLPDEGTLRELYDSGLSSQAIADRYGAKQGVILDLCRKFSVEIRNPGFNGSEFYQCSDGTIVKSVYEARVGDWFLSRSIPFEYEPKIPFQSKWRADFLANGWFVEIWGIVGWESYDEKRRLKTEWYRDHELPLIEIIPHDFSVPKKLEKVMSQSLNFATHFQSIPRVKVRRDGTKINQEGRKFYICQNCSREYVPDRRQVYEGSNPKYCGRNCYYQARFNKKPNDAFLYLLDDLQ